MRNEITVDSNKVKEEIEGLRHLTVGKLKDRYREVFGEESRSNHKQFLFRRVAWRIQANAWGGLSDRARRRALEIADDADLRIRAPKNFLKQGVDESRTVEARVKPSLDPRLPLPGTSLKAVELKREMVAGQERIVWNPALSLPSKEFEFSDPEIARIKAAIQTWDSYGVNADRRWLQPLLDNLFSGAIGA